MNDLVVGIGAESMPELKAVAHHGASYTDRALTTWRPSSGSADMDLNPELGSLRSRSRDLVRNHGLASGGLQAILDNVVGHGLRIQANPDYKALGKDKAWADEWSAHVESQWRSWAETTDCDASGRLNFHLMTALVFRAALESGDAIALPLWLPNRPGSKWSTCLRVIEGDRLSNPHGQEDAKNLKGGVEINAHDRPIAYHIRKTHPGDRYLFGLDGLGEWVRIPARTSWGRPRLLHIYDQQRPGQSRGKPIITPVIKLFKMLDHYQKTELQAAIVNAMIAAFIETTLPVDDIIDEFFDGSAKDYLSTLNENRAQLKAGSIQVLRPGETIKSFLPGRPGSVYKDYEESLIRNIGVGFGLPLELIRKDFSKTNYSSARAAINEVWKFFTGRRFWLAFTWAQPTFTLWMEEAANDKSIDAPDFYKNIYAYTRCRVIGPGRGYVDPTKEAQAAQIRMDSGLSTLQEECAEQGRDWEEVLEQRKREKDRMEELGLNGAYRESANRPVVVANDEDKDQQGKEENP